MPRVSLRSKVPSSKELKKTVAKVEKTKVSSPGLNVSIMDLKGKVVGKITLPKEIFDVKVAPSLITQTIRVFLANQREGNLSTKTRGEVRGSTRKIYRQKGTGKARHGGIRAPIFVGGGIAFGPKPRDFSLSLNKKMKKKALFGALSDKLKNEKIIVIEAGNASGKTKEINGALKALNLVDKKGKAQKVLFVVSKNSPITLRASKNIDGLAVESAGNLNTYGVLNSNYILFQKSAIEDLSKRLIKA